MHLNLDNTITRAGFTTATLDIERETPLLITSNLGLIGLGKQITNIVKDTCVSRWIRTGCTTNWTLVNINQTLDMFDASHRFVFTRFLTISIKLLGNLFLENSINQSRFSRTRNTSDCNQLSKWKLDRYILKVIFTSTFNLDKTTITYTTFQRNRN